MKGEEAALQHFAGFCCLFLGLNLASPTSNLIFNPFRNRFFYVSIRLFLPFPSRVVPVSVLELTPTESKNTLSKQPSVRIQSPESTAESDEICKIFRNKEAPTNSASDSGALDREDEEENCSFVYYEEEPGDRSAEDDTTGKHSVFNDLLFSNCEFDVQTFNQYLNEYDDESDRHKHCPDHNCNSDDEKSDESDFFCDCLVEAVPLYHTNIMRETGGKLRGLLKAPNRPPPARKNRVVFDETRNEFFEADYIILIREDCPYDEEDEEPCTCGDHELVRICCDEGCNCGYTEDGRTPAVSLYFYPRVEPIMQDDFTLQTVYRQTETAPKMRFSCAPRN